MLDLTQGQFVKHVVMHPFEGFEDLRWKKSGSMKIATVIVFLLFFQQLAYNRLYGFQYYTSYDKVFNIIPYIFRSFGLFLLYVVCNWAMCTLFDGEGNAIECAPRAVMTVNMKLPRYAEPLSIIRKQRKQE